MNIQNELGVIVAFSQACKANGWNINHIQIEFPDAIIQDENGDTYRAEFEFCASSFKAHRHDLLGCDVIICWENDWDECPLTIWSMKDWSDPTVTIKNRKDLIIASLTIENERLKRKVSRLTNSSPNREQLFDLNARQFGLIEILGTHPEMNYTEIGQACGVSRTTAKKDTEVLISAGKLTRNGHEWETQT